MNGAGFCTSNCSYNTVILSQPTSNSNITCTIVDCSYNSISCNVSGSLVVGPISAYVNVDNNLMDYNGFSGPCQNLPYGFVSKDIAFIKPDSSFIFNISSDTIIIATNAENITIKGSFISELSGSAYSVSLSSSFCNSLANVKNTSITCIFDIYELLATGPLIATAYFTYYQSASLQIANVVEGFFISNFFDAIIFF